MAQIRFPEHGYRVNIPGLPQIPTDNLYKFAAIGSLFMTLAASDSGQRTTFLADREAGSPSAIDSKTLIRLSKTVAESI